VKISAKFAQKCRFGNKLDFDGGKAIFRRGGSVVIVRTDVGREDPSPLYNVPGLGAYRRAGSAFYSDEQSWRSRRSHAYGHGGGFGRRDGYADAVQEWRMCWRRKWPYVGGVRRIL
jgi:hypothetical protein